MRKTKYATIIADLLAVAIFFGGCSNVAAIADSWTHEGSKETLPIETESVEFIHLLGMGAWATNLTLAQDGSFYGHYHDTNMGEIGDGYPNGTEYTCDFSGRFCVVRQINDYSFAVILEELETEAFDQIWIKDGIRYITTEPAGLTCGAKFLCFTPETPLDQMTDDFLFWWSLRYSDDANSNKLGVCALYSAELGSCFFPAL